MQSSGRPICPSGRSHSSDPQVFASVRDLQWLTHLSNKRDGKPGLIQSPDKPRKIRWALRFITVKTLCQQLKDYARMCKKKVRIQAEGATIFSRRQQWIVLSLCSPSTFGGMLRCQRTAEVNY